MATGQRLLQTILDTSDSDSGDLKRDSLHLNANDKKKYTSSKIGYDAINTSSLELASQARKGRYSYSVPIDADLERILRETDDDDDNYEESDYLENHDLLRTKTFNKSLDDMESLGGSSISSTRYSQVIGSTSSTPLSRKSLLGSSYKRTLGQNASLHSAVGDDDSDDYSSLKKTQATESKRYDNLNQTKISMSNSSDQSRYLLTASKVNMPLNQKRSPSKKENDTVNDMPRLTQRGEELIADMKLADEDEEVNSIILMAENTSPSAHGARNSTTYQKSACNTATYKYGIRHSAEEWAVLQSILGENEDDSDDKEDILPLKIGKQVPSTHLPPVEYKSVNGNVATKRYSGLLSEVDAILEDLDDDSYGDKSDSAAIAELDALASSLNVIRIASKSQVVQFPSESMQVKSVTEGNQPSLHKRNAASRMFSDSSSQLPLPFDLRTRVDYEQTNSHLDRSKEHKEVLFPRTRPHQNTVFQKHAVSDVLTPISNAVSDAAMKNAESIEFRLLRPGQREMISPLMVKRRMKPKIELKAKSRSNKLSVPKSSVHQAQDFPRFGFAGVIDSKSFRNISSELARISQMCRQNIGLPTSLAVNSKFIAIGTQHGITLVFDLFEELRQQLALSSTASTISTIGTSVTSIDMSPNGETLVAGYSNGFIILWDIIKGSVLKTVVDLHPSPVTVCRFVSECQMNVITVDAGGLVNKVSFSKTIWSSIGMESECLLDGAAGQILSMHVLPPFSSLKGSSSFIRDRGKSSVLHPLIKKLSLIAITSERSSFVVAIEPKISVLHRWPRPSDDCVAVNLNEKREINSPENLENAGRTIASHSIFLPCLSWGWSLVSGGENFVTPILARSWGCCLQLLRASFPLLEDNVKNNPDDTNLWPAFGIHDEIEIDAPIVALEWLGDRSLVYLTITNEFTVIDTVMMTLTERLDFSGMKLVYADFAISRPLTTKESDLHAPSMSVTFLNSIRSNDNRILVLCREELYNVAILGIRRRVGALEEDGEWLEALALALDHYESSVKSQEDRKRDPEGKRDLSAHPEFISRLRLSEEDVWLADLLLRYVQLAVENAPEARPKSQMSAKIDLAMTHFQMLAGVCIEFCVVSRRTDLLFIEVYDTFRRNGYSGVFFSVLEPYVLNEKLKYIAPDVMAQFIDHCKVTNDLGTVERCLIHMDVAIMDFDSIVSLLRKNAMYTALFHVFTSGLDDFIAPLEILFEAIFDNFKSLAELSQRRLDGAPLSLFEQYGYKAILFLRYCFEGKTFPQGTSIKPDGRTETLRPQILRFLRQHRHSSYASRVDGHNDVTSWNKQDDLRRCKFPYLYALMLVDSKALIDTLSCVFDNPSVRFLQSNNVQETMAEWHTEAEKNIDDVNDKSLCSDRQDFARILSYVVSEVESIDSDKGFAITVFITDIFYEYITTYLIKGVIRTPKPLTRSIVLRMCNKAIASNSVPIRRDIEKKIISLLEILPRSCYDSDQVLEVVEKAKLTRAALLLHKSCVSQLTSTNPSIDGSSHHFMSVIDCYLQEDEKAFQMEVFSYIKQECMKESVFKPTDEFNSSKLITLRDILLVPLCNKFPALVSLDAISAARLVSEIYVEELDLILQSLDRIGGLIQYNFLNAVISGNLSKIDPFAGPIMLSNLTGRHYRKYLELMVEFHPELVYRHLQTHHNYRVEECLKLCEAYNIPDASAYLLERMGNVSSALQLLLQTLEGRMMNLKRTVRALNPRSYSSGGSSPMFSVIKAIRIEEESVVDPHKLKEIQSSKVILDAALDLCERNSSTSVKKSEHGSQLWFSVLDRLMNAKGFLRLQKELPEHSTIMQDILNELLHVTIQRMVKIVPLPDLIRMITKDHAANRLGEFRDMISTMLLTYSSELKVYSSALNVMYSDSRQMVLTRYSLKKRASKIITVCNRQTNDSSVNFTHVEIAGGRASIIVNQIRAVEQRDSLNVTKLLQRARFGRDQKNSQIGLGIMARGTSMKTRSDKLLSCGTLSDSALMTRHIGLLSDAEHYGRLG